MTYLTEWAFQQCVGIVISVRKKWIFTMIMELKKKRGWMGFMLTSFSDASSFSFSLLNWKCLFYHHADNAHHNWLCLLIRRSYFNRIVDDYLIVILRDDGISGLFLIAISLDESLVMIVQQFRLPDVIHQIIKIFPEKISRKNRKIIDL